MLLVGLGALLVLAEVSMAGRTPASHAEYFEHYEGTATCLECHQDEAEAFFHSQHYQWRGETPQLVNAHGGKQGKLTMINDFCTNPVPNWIGEVTNEEGKVLARGCSGCHAGFGKMPGDELSRAELENIDCLICHASGYRRDVYETEDGGCEWRSILWKNREGLDSVSKRISRPTRTMCLRCHSASGGGPNYKRGDLSYELAKCEPEHDVHMAHEGNDLVCADCHAGKDHRVVGRGADMAATDSPASRLRCDSGECHDSVPHSRELLNRHVKRVDCTVCHIPVFAKADPTDMHRDWSTIRFSEEKGKHGPMIKTESDVVPAYEWFNGTTWAQLPRQPVQRDEQGRVTMAIPQGSRDDPEARIFAFKVHRGRLPVLDEKQWLLPINTEGVYAHGDVDRAVREAAEVLYGLHDISYTWVDTVRYMGIFHEVQPASNALGCLDCHGPDSRLDWGGLGYEADPLAGCLAPTHD
jgi:hypothetical protein